MSNRKTVDEAVTDLLGGIQDLQESIKDGNRDSVAIDHSQLRPVDELDHDFGTYAEERR